MKKNLIEFIKYAIVGGIAALFDMGANYLFLYYVFGSDKNDLRMVTVSIAIGFIIGLIVNYVLSIIFVFTSDNQKKKSKSVKAFLLYALIGVIGFFMAEGLTLLGTNFISTEGIYYIILSAVVKIIVLIWNYLGRKIFVYRENPIKSEEIIEDGQE
ncbi:GtrA family protein [bacterium]|nr:GtrA family protein [bacterium]